MTDTSVALVESLVANHRRFLDFLERRVGSRADAEEILQQAFVKSVEKASEVRDGDKAIPWFYQLLRNAVTDHFRRLSVERRGQERLASDPLQAKYWEDEQAEALVCACMTDLMDTLKPEYRDLLRRVELEGRSVQQEAERAGISATNARVRLHRARKALGRRLELACGTCAEHACLDCTCQPKKTRFY